MNEFEYKGFTYSSDDSRLGDKESIKGKSSEPPKLYKYYSYNNFSIDALRNQYLYASHPYQFNDSMDSSWVLLDFKNITKERYIRLLENCLNTKTKEDVDKLFSYDKDKNFEYIRLLFYITISRTTGFVSLSSNFINNLMWGHYSKETGFVVELDMEILKNNIKILNNDIKNFSLTPIQYVDKLETIDMLREEFKSPFLPFLPFLLATNIKQNNWAYENEWRLRIHKESMDTPKDLSLAIKNFLEIISQIEDVKIDFPFKSNRKVYYPKEAIKGILLGKKFLLQDKYCEKIRYNNGTILFFKEEKEEEKEFIEFVDFLVDNFSDKLYHSSEEYEHDGSIKRGLVSIKLEKIDDYTFKFNENNEYSKL
jgi:hypothetical protein